MWFFELGDRLWHSDSSFPADPREVLAAVGADPAILGRNTEFADMRAAYDALDARTKAEVEDLICEHSLIYSREAIGFTDLTKEEIASFKPVRQRLVRTHPVTGRRSLFLSLAHAGAIVGCRRIPEARMFLRDLTEHATQRGIRVFAPMAAVTTSWSGTIARRCIARAGSTATKCATCDAPRLPAMPQRSSRKRMKRVWPRRPLGPDVVAVLLQISLVIA